MFILIIVAGIGIIATVLIADYLNRVQTLEKQVEKDTQQKAKNIMQLNQKAGRLTAPKSTKDEVVIGYVSMTDMPHIPSDRFLRISMHDLGNSLLVGESGKGKTETAKVICAWAAQYTDYRIIFIDGKSEDKTQREFVSLMIKSGKDPNKILAFPLQPLNGFKGDGTDIFKRFKSIFEDDKGGQTNKYYSNIGSAVMAAVIPETGLVPTSKDDKRLRTAQGIRNLRTVKNSEELQTRLNNIRTITDNVKGTNIEKVLSKLEPKDLIGIQIDMRNFFTEANGCFDGEKGFEDIDCAYFKLQGTSDPKGARLIANYLTADFIDFITSPKRKKDNRRTLFIFDEISAVPEVPVLGMYERLRAKGANVIIAGQSYNRLAKTEDERRGLLSAKNSVLLHKIDEPEIFTNLAGAAPDIVRVRQEKDGLPTGVESIKLDKKFKVSPDDVRQLQEGELFYIKNGKFARVKVIPVITDAESDRKTDQLFTQWENEARQKRATTVNLDELLAEYESQESKDTQLSQNRNDSHNQSKIEIDEPPVDHSDTSYYPTEEEIEECIQTLTEQEKKIIRDAATKYLKASWLMDNVKLTPNEKARAGHYMGQKAVRQLAIERLINNHNKGYEDMFGE